MKLPVAIVIAALLIAGAILYVNQVPEPTYQAPAVEVDPNQGFQDRTDELSERSEMEAIERELDTLRFCQSNPDAPQCY